MKSTVAQCAQLVRKDLKALYPSIKFTVRSENYSGGDSVNVGYPVNELTHEQHKALNALLRSRYQYGHFNGMEDIYEYSNTKNIPQTMFLFLDSIN